MKANIDSINRPKYQMLYLVTYVWAQLYSQYKTAEYTAWASTQSTQRPNTQLVPVHQYHFVENTKLLNAAVRDPQQCQVVSSAFVRLIRTSADQYLLSLIHI